MVPTGFPLKYTRDFLRLSHASATMGCVENGVWNPDRGVPDRMLILGDDIMLTLGDDIDSRPSELLTVSRPLGWVTEIARSLRVFSSRDLRSRFRGLGLVSIRDSSRDILVSIVIEKVLYGARRRFYSRRIYFKMPRLFCRDGWEKTTKTRINQMTEN